MLKGVGRQVLYFCRDEKRIHVAFNKLLIKVVDGVIGDVNEGQEFCKLQNVVYDAENRTVQIQSLCKDNDSGKHLICT